MARLLISLLFEASAARLEEAKCRLNIIVSYGASSCVRLERFHAADISSISSNAEVRIAKAGAVRVAAANAAAAGDAA